MEIPNHTVLEIIVYAISMALTFIFGHNLWLVPKNEEDKLEIEIVTSDWFPVSDTAVKPERVKSFQVFTEEGSFDVSSFQTSENSLIAELKKSDKVETAALELYPHPIVLEAEKFAGYIKSENAAAFVAPGFIEGQTLVSQRESYAKFAKVLFDNESFDLIVGHRLEIILQENPSEIGEEGEISLKVLFDGSPKKNLRVSSGSENPDGEKYAAHSRTDENGDAKIAIPGKGLWFIRTHFIRPHLNKDEFDWESFWATITFRI